jgi:hypothetical protein
MKLVDLLKMKKIVLVVLCSWLIACGNDKDIAIPEHILSREKMAQVMTDMHLLEASMNLNISNKITTDKAPDLENRIRSVLKKNAITREQYETSFSFYAAHTELLSELYTEVLNNLSKLQAKVANEKTPDSAKASVDKGMIPVNDKEQPKKDSLPKTVNGISKKDSIRKFPDPLDHRKLLPGKKKK